MRRTREETESVGDKGCLQGLVKALSPCTVGPDAKTWFLERTSLSSISLSSPQCSSPAYCAPPGEEDLMDP